MANICRLVNNTAVAEDLLQEVFVALWENRHKLTEAHSVAGWLFTASYYKALDYLKKAVKEKLLPITDTLQELLPAEETTTAGQEYLQMYELLTEAISELSPRKQTVFRLCRLEGRSYKEAAQQLGISVESVKDYLKLSAAHIRQHITTRNPALPLLTLYIASTL